MSDVIGRDDVAAWACIRLDRLGTGLRFVHLFDANGVQTNGILLVRITKSITMTKPDLPKQKTSS
jgi:phosphatidylinositol phospholipase C, delta